MFTARLQPTSSREETVPVLAVMIHRSSWTSAVAANGMYTYSYTLYAHFNNISGNKNELHNYYLAFFTTIAKFILCL